MLVVLVGASSAGATPDDWWFGRSKVMIRGAAASESPGGGYGLGIYARNNGAPEDGWGQIRFGAADARGLIQVSGRVFASGGRNDAARDFAVTIDTESRPQRFSGVRLGAPGSIAPCSGGTAEFHPVTRGGYESSPPDGK
jgi:hypothetical protein